MTRERKHPPVVCPYCGLQVGVTAIKTHVYRYHPNEEELKTRREENKQTRKEVELNES